jgi:hypothetical protein
LIGTCRFVRQRWPVATLAFISLVACRAEHPPRARVNPAISRLPDSLVVTGPKGLEVWFTLSRASHSPSGTSCVERGLEIRRGETRTPVPLLYTGAAPILVNDTTLRAELWNHCKPVSVYLVNLMSGQPVRERSRSAP